MENGGESANGEAPTKTLTREDSLYGDAFASPTKGEDSERTVPIEEEADSGADAEAALHRVKEEKVALEKELEEVRRAQLAVASEASRLEGEVVRLQSDLFSAEAAAEAAEGEATRLKSEADSLSKALQNAKVQKKDAEEKFVVEKMKLLGQIELLKQKLYQLEEELSQTKLHNVTLQVEIENKNQNAAISAAKAHQDMAEVIERNAFLEAEMFKKNEKVEEDVVVVKEVTSPPNWVNNVVAASTGAVAAVVVMSLYLRLRRQQ